MSFYTLAAHPLQGLGFIPIPCRALQAGRLCWLTPSNFTTSNGQLLNLLVWLLDIPQQVATNAIRTRQKQLSTPADTVCVIVVSIKYAPKHATVVMASVLPRQQKFDPNPNTEGIRNRSHSSCLIPPTGQRPSWLCWPGKAPTNT